MMVRGSGMHHVNDSSHKDRSMCVCWGGESERDTHSCAFQITADVCLLHLHRSLSRGQSRRGILTILAPRQVQSTKCFGVISNTSRI